MNTQIITNAQNLINTQQTGFMPNCFIATSRLMAQMVMENAQQYNNQNIGPLLDQEKAYDRIHLSYRTNTLKKFGFPGSIIKAIATFF